MFDQNDMKRWKIDQVLQHPWLKGDMPTHEQVVSALAGRHAGIVVRGEQQRTHEAEMEKQGRGERERERENVERKGKGGLFTQYE